MIALALSTHTMPSWWLDEDDRTIATAWELLDEQRDAMKGGDGG